MRVATWNVNSLKQRMPRFLPWLDERRPDVVCLQETKLADDALAELLGDELADRGYEVAAHGEATWNGVAILSRVGPGGRGHGTRGRAGLSASRGSGRGGHLWRDPGRTRVYVPNGREPGSDHYEYKLEWLARAAGMWSPPARTRRRCG